MSGTEGNFLARWSRRKRAAKQATALPPDEGPAGTSTPSTAARELPKDQARGGEATASAVLSPLPRIEALTAESDITAFLRSDVPAAIRMAALRRIWTLDPAIRDYVGPSENAWDFNNPDTIPGFCSPGSLGKAFAQAIGRLPGPDAAPALARGEGGSAPARSATGRPASVPLNGGGGTEATQNALQCADAPVELVSRHALTEEASGRRGTPDRTGPPPRHGGAVPH